MELYEWLIIVFSVSAAIVLAIFLYHPLRRLITKKHTVRVYYKTVYKVAKYGDYYLINNLILELDATSQAHVDHILFADKYIYVVSDVYLQGEISGLAQDEKWLYLKGKKRKQKKYVIDNLLIENRQRLEKVALVTNLDPDLFISILLVNDEVNPFKIENTSKMDYIVRRKDLYQLILSIEKRLVSPLAEKELSQAVLDIDALNLRKKSKKGKKK